MLIYTNIICKDNSLAQKSQSCYLQIIMIFFKNCHNYRIILRVVLEFVTRPGHSLCNKSHHHSFEMHYFFSRLPSFSKFCLNERSLNERSLNEWRSVEERERYLELTLTGASAEFRVNFCAFKNINYYQLNFKLIQTIFQRIFQYFPFLNDNFSTSLSYI